MATKSTPRKIVQVAALRVQGVRPDGSPDDVKTEVVALCDDGSVWTMFDTLSGEWVPLPKIPQWQLFEDWRDDVGELLTSRHLIRKDALSQILKDHHSTLMADYNAGRVATEAAEAVYAHYKQ